MMLTWKEKESCNVIWDGCLQPPAFADSDCKEECFACGYNVCTNCSALMQYRNYGRQRICFNCVIEHSDHPEWAQRVIRCYREDRANNKRPEAWNVKWV